MNPLTKSLSDGEKNKGNIESTPSEYLECSGTATNPSDHSTMSKNKAGLTQKNNSIYFIQGLAGHFEDCHFFGFRYETTEMDRETTRAF